MVEPGVGWVGAGACEPAWVLVESGYWGDSAGEWVGGGRGEAVAFGDDVAGDIEAVLICVYSCAVSVVYIVFCILYSCIVLGSV